MKEDMYSKMGIFIKKSVASKSLIIFIPGLFSRIENLPFSFLQFSSTPNEFDMFVCRGYDGTDKRTVMKTLSSIIRDLSATIKFFSRKYKNIFIITHSFGSNTVLFMKLPLNVRGIAFWSPSFFYPQKVTETLPPLEGTTNLLIVDKEKEIYINKKLSKELDNLDTKKMLSSLDKNRPIHVYCSSDDQGKRSWCDNDIVEIMPSNQKYLTQTPYQHNYSDKEMQEIYSLTTSWFTEILKK